MHPGVSFLKRAAFDLVFFLFGTRAQRSRRRSPFGRVLGAVLLKRSSEREAAARRGDGTAEFLGSFDPFLNDDLDVGKSFLVGLSVGSAAGQLGDFGDPNR